jgi:hypothetical protein
MAAGALPVHRFGTAVSGDTAIWSGDDIGN